MQLLWQRPLACWRRASFDGYGRRSRQGLEPVDLSACLAGKLNGLSTR
jgi:hypothetical protein